MLQKVWRGEHHERYANEISRLVWLVGLLKDSLTKIVKWNFMYELPNSLGVELKRIQNLLSQPMSNIIDWKCILTSNRGKYLAAINKSLFQGG